MLHNDHELFEQLILKTSESLGINTPVLLNLAGERLTANSCDILPNQNKA